MKSRKNCWISPMLWPPAETRPTFGRYKPAGQNPLISGRLELVGLKKVETHARSGDYFILLCFPRPKLTFSADAGGDVRRFDVFSPPTPSFWEANRRGLTQDAALFPACSVSSPRHKAGKTLNCLVFPARISILGSSKAGMILSGFVIPRHETALAADAGGDVK